MMKLDEQLTIMSADRLQILSAHLQDAIIRTGDMAFLPHARRFAAICNRFRWENNDENQRIISGLHFDNVQKTESCGIDQSQCDRFLHLLAICFEAGSKPSGKIRLIFANQAEICLEVEAVEAHLNNVGKAWTVKSRPQHSVLGKNT